MIRATKACTILKKELESGLVVKHIQQTDQGEMCEYWVYIDPTSSVIDGATGDIALAKNNPSERTLKCVVVCENQDDHIVKDMPNHIIVKGFIFSDVDYYDLTDYLGRTGRHL